MPSSWSDSTRRDRLPRNWPRIRARILRRDPVCRCAGCVRCSPHGCPRRSTQADHITPGDDHSDTNLRGLCSDCHAIKSSAEGITARGHGPNRYRPRETHPGQR